MELTPDFSITFGGGGNFPKDRLLSIRTTDEDGIVGPQTLSAINFSNPKVLIAAIKSEAAGYYRALVAKNSNQKKFLNSWLSRAYRGV